MKTYETNFQLDFPTSIYIIHKKKKINLFQNPFSIEIDGVESNFQIGVIELQNINDLKTAFKKSSNFLYSIY